MSGGMFLVFVLVGDILIDMVCVGDVQWMLVLGGVGWNVVCVVVWFGVLSVFVGVIGEDCFFDVLWYMSEVVGFDLCFLQCVVWLLLFVIVYEMCLFVYFFIGEVSVDFVFDFVWLLVGWIEYVKWVYFGCISFVCELFVGMLVVFVVDLYVCGVKISFDLNCWNLMMVVYWLMFEKMVVFVDLIKVFDEDLCYLFGGDGFDVIVVVCVLNLWVVVFVMCGVQVVMFYVDGDVYEVSLLCVEVVDMVGVGDVLIGGLLFSLMVVLQCGWCEYFVFVLVVGVVVCWYMGVYVLMFDEVVVLFEG